MVKERIAQQQQKVVEVQLQEQCKSDVVKTPAAADVTQTEADRNVHPLKLLFNLENARSMHRIVLKERPNKGRKQILLAILSLSILFGEQIGTYQIRIRIMWTDIEFVYFAQRWDRLTASSSNECTIGIPITQRI